MSLQVLNTILLTAFGVVSLRIAERLTALQRDSDSWMLTGLAFFLTGMVAAVQNAWGTWALVEGAGSGVWDAYLRWTAAFNHSRTVALIVFGLLLIGSVVLPARTPLHPRSPRTLAAIFGGLAVGGLIGWAEGTFVTQVHLTRVMALDTVEVVVLLVALFALLLRDRADRLLWLALVTYALNVAVNTLWSPTFIRIGVPGAWQPPYWTMHVHRVTFAAVMVALAWRRSSLARTDKWVPTVYGTLQ